MLRQGSYTFEPGKLYLRLSQRLLSDYYSLFIKYNIDLKQ
ncbi:hypothetical protein PUND_b0202 [Pseudoalteromonas undina]|nr:hypothetical protein PUND_b0202 [Pseudoalteromonas undina]GAA65209.1 hypothetical protein P20311_3018 [Pseudoalteromonas sp. BSi20311]GAA70925.1 hypothetical protein P20439_0992 [Pseudoalteromonas sp. BSi20439]